MVGAERLTARSFQPTDNERTIDTAFLCCPLLRDAERTSVGIDWLYLLLRNDVAVNAVGYRSANWV